MKLDELSFDELGLGVACLAAKGKHEMLTLKLNGLLLGAEVLSEPLESVIQSRIGFKDVPGFTIDNFSNFNMDSLINKLTTPLSIEQAEIASCLDDILAGKLDGNFNKLDNFIKEEGGKIKSFSNHLFGLLEDFAHEGIDAAEGIINKMMNLVLSPEDKLLFGMLDELEKYIQATNILNVYKDWRDMTKCISVNCPLLKDILEDDSFMYSDDKKLRFILPVDINNGVIRLYKFFPGGVKDPTQKKKLNVLESKYHKYKSTKLQKTREAEHKLNQIGVKNNPFTTILNNSVTNTINNLF